jgi:tRNA pseudouridine38-40 synthase
MVQTDLAAQSDLADRQVLSMRFVRLTVAYDGTAFCGFQFQPNRRTIQTALEDAIFRVTGETLRVVGAGRTDAGVHALEQVVSFSTTSTHAPHVLRRALNSELPDDMVILEVAEAPEGFDAIDWAKGKRYRYLIDDGTMRDVFARNYTWRVWQRLNIPHMYQAAQTLCGTHDFRSFQNAGSSRVRTVRTVRELTVERQPFGDNDRVVIEIEADGFLYNMVRNIVGTLVQVGRDKASVSWPAEVLATQNRRLAGMCAPAHGLYLVKVYY